MGQKLFVTALVLITAAYCWGLGWIAWGFLRAGGVVGYGLALGIVVLLALTVWVTWREVLFGLAAGRLAARYSPPASAIEGDARAEFEAARTEIQDTPEAETEWRAWFRLALAYDALRDRKGARMATRRAIAAQKR
ncbi:hypothetical protein [Brachybacterium sp. UNK5269]|uniref:hypothetical protein n=1 Tax=Brachybacterium sp. UNK5269 TaxID=3408576 RepID=UPI003BB14721